MKSFKEYLEYKAPFVSRLGSAIGSGLDAAKKTMSQQTFTRPSSAGGDDDFHQAVDALSDKVGRWVYNKYR